jgi:Tol biopolymer transport system component
MAQPFDAQRLKFTGEPVPVVPDAVPGSLFSFWSYSASAGALAYVTTRAGNNGQLKWIDRAANFSGSVKQPADMEYLNPVFSPDESRIAVNVMDPRSGNWDIWAVDLASQIPKDSDAVWSHDGKSVVFVSNRDGGFGLYRKTLSSEGSEELLVKTDLEPRADDWTSDGRFVIFDMNRDIMAVDLKSSNRQQIPVVKTPFSEYGAKTSPDGKWIAYASNETGQYQIYIQPFPGPGERKLISTVYGIHPRWRGDGRELVYWQVPGALMSVDLRFEGGGVQAGTPRPVFPPHVYILDLLDARHHHAMTADGKRFLLRQAAGQQGPPVNVILNWTTMLSK